MQESLKAFGRLLEIMDDLREKCPWDKKQTMESLRILTIEETYELADAILDKDIQGVKEEIGDLMLHMVFYAKIGAEKEAFDIADALNAVCDKLVHRHPHIYGDLKVSGEEEVKANWEKLKLKEGKKSILEGVPKSLPAMVKAFRIQDKAGQVGFQWKEIKDVEAKVQEELAELAEAQTQAHKEEEFGDLLFALVNLARYKGIDPEAALERSNKKFIRRFEHVEEKVIASGMALGDSSLEEMDGYWNEAKDLGL